MAFTFGSSLGANYRYCATVTADGPRLDEFLESQIGGLSRMRIRNLIVDGACRINGKTARPGDRLSKGDLIELEFDRNIPTAMDPERIALEVIYEDDHLLVVNKPSGMLVHPTVGVKRGTLANALTYHLNRSALERPENHDNLTLTPLIRPGIVHRLDRDTSGLMVVAKTQHALRLLSKHFNRRLVEKRYLAAVRGVIRDDVDTIEAPIGRDPALRPRWRVLETGKPSTTRFRVLERHTNSSLVELEPLTGRTNQLRIHMSHIGHPIIGDALYDRDREQAQRLFLHASVLAFHHPIGGEWLRFSVECSDFTKAGFMKDSARNSIEG